jgi:hypothetical protein
LALKKVALVVTSAVHAPKALEKPRSGLIDQRRLPRLIALAGSYWPLGADTCTLAPMTRSLS